MSLDHATSERAYRALKADLFAGQLRDAPTINIAALTRRYAVSATPVREALLRLTGEGLVLMRSTGGFALPRPSARRINQLLATEAILLRAAIASLGERPGGPARWRRAGKRPSDETDRTSFEQLAAKLGHASGMRPLCISVLRLGEQLRHLRHLARSGDDDDAAAKIGKALDRGDWAGSVILFDQRYRLEASRLPAKLPPPI